ncbi:unnamed protein product [Prorocentrum cordatum]|uniref:Uncharacterized protein n=1 Tax=Prorocentrum cordatum TaxID=2364126 RepID=A0ABN9VYN5_9DINO|nr:unnamed protein product [Polarella glacialis]
MGVAGAADPGRAPERNGPTARGGHTPRQRADSSDPGHPSADRWADGAAGAADAHPDGSRHHLRRRGGLPHPQRSVPGLGPVAGLRGAAEQDLAADPAHPGRALVPPAVLERGHGAAPPRPARVASRRRSGWAGTR